MSQQVNRRRATKERHDTLVALIRDGITSVDQLAARVGISPSTVRRDLTQLQSAGRIARTYGGALAQEPFQERSFGESARLNQQAKNRIAVAAAELVPIGATVFLDAGTTCLALARVLAERGPFTVVTRGLEAALLLAASPHIDLVVLGGNVRSLSHGLVGPLSSVTLERLSFEIAFLGADVVDPDRGLGEPTADETFVKELAASRADQVFVLADATKLGQANVMSWLPLGRDWTLVTDSEVSAQAVEALEAHGVRVVAA